MVEHADISNRRMRSQGAGAKVSRIQDGAAMAAYLDTMQRFLATQQSVMQAYLTAPPEPQLTWDVGDPLLPARRELVRAAARARGNPEGAGSA